MDDSSSRPPGSDQESAQQPGTTTGRLRDTVTGILENLQTIVRDEMQLAKVELREEAGQLGKAGGMVAGAGVLGLTGFIFLMLSVTYMLNRKLAMWLSAGIVGTALVTVAGVLGTIGKRQVQRAQLTPEQTIDSLKDDAAWARREASSVTDEIRSVTE